MIWEIEEFGQFAENCFTSHAVELYNVVHSGQPVARESISQAYQASNRVLNEELDKKINDLCGNEDMLVRERLLSIKEKYMHNLVFRATRNL
jgi:hypothetical protein